MHIFVYYITYKKNLSIILIPKIKFNQAIMCGSYSKKEKYGCPGYLSQYTCYEVTIPGHIWISAEGCATYHETAPGVEPFWLHFFSQWTSSYKGVLCLIGGKKIKINILTLVGGEYSGYYEIPAFFDSIIYRKCFMKVLSKCEITKVVEGIIKNYNYGTWVCAPWTPCK